MVKLLSFNANLSDFIPCLAELFLDHQRSGQVVIPYVNHEQKCDEICVEKIGWNLAILVLGQIKAFRPKPGKRSRPLSSLRPIAQSLALSLTISLSLLTLWRICRLLGHPNCKCQRNEYFLGRIAGVISNSEGSNLNDQNIHFIFFIRF